MCQQAADVEKTSPVLKVDASFVWVPALVRSETGLTVRGISTDKFQLWDNGVPQQVVPIETDDLPVSLVILMQTGGPADRYLSSYSDLPSMLVRLVGSSVHEITLVTFDSHVGQIWHFPMRSDGVNYALTHQHAGDRGAAIKDAVDFGVRQLQDEPGRFRRIVLLLSQGVDEGSTTPSQAVVEQLGMASTAVYSLVFPGDKRKSKRQTHGTRPHDFAGTAATLERATRALDNDTAAELAAFTGGSSIKFRDQQSFNSAFLQIVAAARDGYTLGFQPTRATPGLHTIRVQINSPKLEVSARSAYWCQPDAQH